MVSSVVVATSVAAQLGVSRIPVMHACQRLVGEGFLVANPRRSVTVAPLTEERIAEGNEVLLALECVALEHAARRATREDLEHWAALNRAVRCFAPAGSSSCGGNDIPVAQRKAWFERLKRDYPQSPWARDLKVYW